MVSITFEKKKPLSDALEDFLIANHDFDLTKKKFLSFSVCQVYLTNEISSVIVRYDSSHGYCHVHRFYKYLNPKRESLHKPISSETFKECRLDILLNWASYKQQYLTLQRPK